MKSVPESHTSSIQCKQRCYPVLDSLYKTIKSNSLVKSGNQYKTIDFEDEKTASHFRNNGVYYFHTVNFDIDTIKKENKADVNIISIITPIKITTQLKRSLLKSIISDVNIYTDYSPATSKSKITDSTTYNNFNLYNTIN
jgi:hypothetical protein